MRQCTAIPFAALAAERFEQAFFFFLCELGESVEGSKIAGQSSGGKPRKGFSREPGIAGPAAGKENQGADAAEDDLHAKKRQDRHAGLALTAHLAKVEFAGKIERGPIGDGQLPCYGEDDGREGGDKSRSGRKADAVREKNDGKNEL